MINIGGLEEAYIVMWCKTIGQNEVLICFEKLFVFQNKQIIAVTAVITSSFSSKKTVSFDIENIVQAEFLPAEVIVN